MGVLMCQRLALALPALIAVDGHTWADRLVKGKETSDPCRQRHGEDPHPDFDFENRANVREGPIPKAKSPALLIGGDFCPALEIAFESKRWRMTAYERRIK